MSDLDDNLADDEEIALEICLSTDWKTLTAGVWPDFESALDDSEPQPEPGDFLEPESEEKEE